MDMLMLHGRNSMGFARGTMAPPSIWSSQPARFFFLAVSLIFSEVAMMLDRLVSLVDSFEFMNRLCKYQKRHAFEGVDIREQGFNHVLN